MTHDEAIAMIRAEVAKATEKFPTWPTRATDAAVVLGEEAGELVKAVNEHTYEPEKSSLADVRKEVIQTGAMAVRFLMSLHRYDWSAGEQHTQNDEPTRCKHCGADMARSLERGITTCAPPFDVQPHDFGV